MSPQTASLEVGRELVYLGKTLPVERTATK